MLPRKLPGKQITELTEIINNILALEQLSRLSKLAEKTILQKLNNHLAEWRVLKEEQFGFRPGHSTIHQTTKITNYIYDRIHCRQRVGAVFSTSPTTWTKCGTAYLQDGQGKHTPPLSWQDDTQHHEQNITNKTRQPQIQDGADRNWDSSPLSVTLFNIYTTDIPAPPSNVCRRYCHTNGQQTPRKRDEQTTIIHQHHCKMDEGVGNQGQPKQDRSHPFFSKGRARPRGHTNLNDTREKVKYLGLKFDRRITWNHNHMLFIWRYFEF